MKKSIIKRAISSDGGIRVIFCDSTEIVRRSCEIHHTSKTMTAVLGRALTATSLMSCLLKDKDNAFLSRSLAQICTNVPLNKNLQDLKRLPIDKAGLYKKFNELELNSLIAKFGLTEVTEEKSGFSEESALVSTKTFYINSGAEEIIRNVKKRFSFEILNGIVYISTNNQHFSFEGKLFDIAEIFDDAEIICYDGKALWHLLKSNGIGLDSTRFIDLLLYAGANLSFLCTKLQNGKCSPIYYISRYFCRSRYRHVFHCNLPCQAICNILKKLQAEKLLLWGIKLIYLCQNILFQTEQILL